MRPSQPLQRSKAHQSCSESCPDSYWLVRLVDAFEKLSGADLSAAPPFDEPVVTALKAQLARSALARVGGRSEFRLPN
jgi:hypothetical protein